MKKIIIAVALAVLLLGTGVILWQPRLTTPREPVPGFDTPAIGFFYFGGYDQLDPVLFKSAHVRVAIEWNNFEPRQGIFVWDQQNTHAQKIDELLAAGKKIVPSIRSRSNWAVPATEGKCAAAPLDLNTQAPLQAGTSYSNTYYTFVRNIAEHYQGKFEIVVIENEMNDTDFWCASTDSYLRLFLTAQKAFQDIDPAVKLADGAIQGAALNWLVIEDYLRQKNTAAALAFYEKFSGQQISQLELESQVAKYARKEPVMRAQQFFGSQLFAWVDLANFHYYQKSDALPEVVAYIRRNIPARKTLMTNEVGIKERFSHSPEAAAQEMVKKYAHLLALRVSPIVWFSPGGKQDNNAGALIDEHGQIVTPLKNSFEAVARFLGQPSLSCRDTSTPTIARFQCRSPREAVTVMWLNGENTTDTIKIEHNCSAYSYQNQAITGPEVAVTTAPLFIVCRGGN